MAGKHFDLDRSTNLGGENSSDITIASQKATKTYIDQALQGKQDSLTAGANISISAEGVISASLSGSGSALADLSDVNLSEVSNGNIIQYNESTSKWENKSLDVPIVPTNISSFTNDAGYITDAALSEYMKASESYTKTEVDTNLVPNTRTINNKALSANLTLSASDVNALPASTAIPSNTSDLNNDSGFITDISTKQDAETAVKFDGSSAVGSSIKGIFVTADGNVSECDYSIAKSVPSDADFNDTTYSAGTGLSLSGTTINHINTTTAGTIGPSESSSGTSFDIPVITYDSEGHITVTETKTHTVTGFLTEHQDISGKANISEMAEVAFSGNYEDLTNTPTIPSTASDIGAASESHTHEGYVSTSTTVAGKALTGDITLSASDVGALPSETVIPDVSALAEDSLVVHLAGSETITGDKTFDSLTMSSSPSDADDSNKVATTSFVKAQGYLTNMSISQISDISLSSLNDSDLLSYDSSTHTWTNVSLSIPSDTSDLNNGAGFITGIDSTDVTTALGYTPYDGATNPNGYLTSLTAGTGISVSGNEIINTGVISITEGSTAGAIVANINGSETVVNVHGLGTAAFTDSSSYAGSSHNQAANTINVMTGYVIATASTAISESDTLNEALGKLEYKVDNSSGGGGGSSSGLILVEQLAGSSSS